MKSWKRYEKDLTTYLRGHTRWKTKRRSRAKMGEDVMDIECGPLAIEAKCPKGRPQYIEDWLDQADKNKEGKYPVVIWHQAYESIDNDVVLMRLGDLVTFICALQRDKENLQPVRDIMRAIEIIEHALEKI